MAESNETLSELTSLTELFFGSPTEVGEMTPVPSDDLPAPYSQLLAHEHHMTVTVEAFHNSPVEVRVLQVARDEHRYAREILLAKQTDGRVVQYGIMRINFDLLSPEVQAEIESESIPLGRILIGHNLLRRIRLLNVWRVEPTQRLAELFGLAEPQTTYGRTAIIDVNHEPAVELLEIVAPEAAK